VALMLGAFFSVNLLLAVFNLLPLPPLDGSGAVPLFLSEETSRRYQTFLWTNRGLGFLGIFIAWQAFGFVFRPLFTGAVNLLYPGVSYE
jgi:Zn-dependent protease